MKVLSIKYLTISLDLAFGISCISSCSENALLQDLVDSRNCWFVFCVTCALNDAQPIALTQIPWSHKLTRKHLFILFSFGRFCFQCAINYWVFIIFPMLAATWKNISTFLSSKFYFSLVFKSDLLLISSEFDVLNHIINYDVSRISCQFHWQWLTLFLQYFTFSMSSSSILEWN